jgi:hypothetical protein
VTGQAHAVAHDTPIGAEPPVKGPATPILIGSAANLASNEMM